MLIAVLFLQETIKGVVSEFSVHKSENPSLERYQFHWLYTNGLLGIIFSFGLLYTALKSRRARSWWYGTGSLRSFFSDYGVPLMVVILTALSFTIPPKVTSGVPRRLFTPLPWEFRFFGTLDCHQGVAVLGIYCKETMHYLLLICIISWAADLQMSSCFFVSRIVLESLFLCFAG